MQSNQLKIILSIFLGSFIGVFSIQAQDLSRDLEIADSLFTEKKFTEAFDIYNAIYETGEEASPAMLLKMAYIKEGLGDPSGAMYYLNTYYLKTKNDKALDKMDHLAEEYQLSGYDVNGGSKLMNYYYKHISEVMTVMIVVVVMLFAALIVIKVKKNKFSYGIGFGLLIISGLLFYMVNFTLDYDEGILTNKNNYIMSAPSAGADVLTVQGAGHKVDILGQEDVWVKIMWNGEEGYVKDSHLKRLYF